jgi:hypoxanthine phosphoribosyltransferase
MKIYRRTAVGSVHRPFTEFTYKPQAAVVYLRGGIIYGRTLSWHSDYLSLILYLLVICLQNYQEIVAAEFFFLMLNIRDYTVSKNIFYGIPRGLCVLI